MHSFDHAPESIPGRPPDRITISDEALNQARQARLLHTQADRCRRLARAIGDREAVVTLDLLADEYDEQASVLEKTQN